MEQASAQPAINTQLQKPWLLPVRILWLTTSLIALGFFIAGLPLRANEIRDLYQGSIQALLTQNQKAETVISTWPGSAAASAGVLQDDILLAVDDVPITSVEQANTLLAGAIGTPVTVSVRTGNFSPRQLTVTRGSVVGSILLEYGLSSQFAVIFVLASEILFAMLCIGIASVIFWHRSDDWMALLSTIVLTMILVGLSLPVLALAESLGNVRNPYWIDAWFAFAFGLLILFFIFFPAGVSHHG